MKGYQQDCSRKPAEDYSQYTIYISRMMTDTEKRYSQTEKDALAIKWAKNQLKIYLLGAPKFRIVTSHKPLIPLFTKPTAKLPPRIERCVMEMQDVDYELVYVPGKDECDPMDYLSRHPLRYTGSDSTGKVVRHIVTNENAIVLERIVKETSDDEQLMKVADRIRRGDWETYKRDLDVAPFYDIKGELSEVDGVILRLTRIVVPVALQRKLVTAAPTMGQFGVTKTKQRLRQKYYIPRMNAVIEDIIGSCLQCRLVSKERNNQPVKLMDIPDRPWDTVAADFGGPYPDGHYNLVLIDKYSRYPEVEFTESTSFKAIKPKLQRMFSTHGTPRRLETDNGPPFNSEAFAVFAKEQGFKHHRVTLAHAQANGEVERFMAVLNKTEHIAKLEGKDYKSCIYDTLTAYRATPHPAHGKTPYQLMMKRDIRTKLDHYIEAVPDTDNVLPPLSPL